MSTKAVLRFLIVIGVLLFIGGFVYDAVYAGIPYQDPTPEMSAHYAREARIASTIMVTGAVAFISGILASLVYPKKEKPNQSPEPTR